MAYDGNGNLIYVGLSHPNVANADPLWQIRQFTYDGNGNLVYTLFANGRRDFVNIWDDRATYSYS